MSLHVTPGPTVVKRVEAAGDKWCFRCRKRLSHVAVLLGYDRPSYYDPMWTLRCAGCGGNYTIFGSA